MPRGGKRPGAGAPRGNLNGFKHGRNSQQHQKLLQLIARDPEVVAMLRERAEHNQRRANRLRMLALYELNQSIPPPGWVAPARNRHNFRPRRGKFLKSNQTPYLNGAAQSNSE